MIADVGALGGGLAVAQLLARANLIANKNLLPHDAPEDWERPSGLRLGTIEVTRLGMKEKEMAQIAELITRVLIGNEAPESVMEDVVELREPFQTLYYCFDHGLPT